MATPQHDHLTSGKPMYASLKRMALYGSVTAKAAALAILDSESNGKLLKALIKILKEEGGEDL